MDGLFTSVVVDKMTNEDFENNDSRSFFSPMRIICILVSIIAIYLSLTCNTKKGTAIGMKIFRAILSGLFGTVYIIWYAIS